MKEPLYRKLASLVDAYKRCAESGNVEWQAKHRERIRAAVRKHMPSGSGFDNGTTLDLDDSTEDKLVFRTAFHHMNDDGMYDGWTEHTVVVKPSLAFGFKLDVTGRDRRQIKEYIGEVFHEALKVEVDDA